MQIIFRPLENKNIEVYLGNNGNSIAHLGEIEQKDDGVPPNLYRFIQTSFLGEHIKPFLTGMVFYDLPHLKKQIVRGLKEGKL